MQSAEKLANRKYYASRPIFESVFESDCQFAAYHSAGPPEFPGPTIE